MNNGGGQEVSKLLRLYEGLNHATQVEIAIKQHHVKFLDYLLKRENVLEQRHMWMAVVARTPRVIKYLFGKGLKIWGSYLVAAAQKAQVEVVKTLVGLGADVNTKDDEGFSPLARCLETVVQPKVLAVVKFLLDNGADVNSIDNLGHTPLIVCVKKRCCSEMYDVVKVLLRRGADERATDSNGLSIKQILFDRDWIWKKTLGGPYYRQVAPVLKRVNIWRDKQSFSRVCSTFYCIWKSSSSPATPGTSSTTSTIKKPRTSLNASVLEAKVDVLLVIFSFL